MTTKTRREAALDHLRATGATGWLEWDELCEIAGIGDRDLGGTVERFVRGGTDDACEMLRALADAGVRVIRVPGERARFKSPFYAFGELLSDVLAEA